MSKSLGSRSFPNHSVIRMLLASSFDPSILILYFKVIVIFYPKAEVKILQAMGNKKRFGCFMFLGRCRKFVSERHLALFVLNSWMSWWFYFMLIEGHLATIPALFPKSGYLLQTNDATFAKCHITSFASAKLTFFSSKVQQTAICCKHHPLLLLLLMEYDSWVVMHFISSLGKRGLFFIFWMIYLQQLWMSVEFIKSIQMNRWEA